MGVAVMGVWVHTRSRAAPPPFCSHPSLVPLTNPSSRPSLAATPLSERLQRCVQIALLTLRPDRILMLRPDCIVDAQIRSHQWRSTCASSTSQTPSPRTLAPTHPPPRQNCFNFNNSKNQITSVVRHLRSITTLSPLPPHPPPPRPTPPPPQNGFDVDKSKDQIASVARHLRIIKRSSGSGSSKQQQHHEEKPLVEEAAPPPPAPVVAPVVVETPPPPQKKGWFGF